jgi:hypothetical protein
VTAHGVFTVVYGVGIPSAARFMEGRMDFKDHRKGDIVHDITKKIWGTYANTLEIRGDKDRAEEIRKRILQEEQERSQFLCDYCQDFPYQGRYWVDTINKYMRLCKTCRIAQLKGEI